MLSPGALPGDSPQRTPESSSGSSTHQPKVEAALVLQSHMARVSGKGLRAGRALDRDDVLAIAATGRVPLNRVGVGDGVARPIDDDAAGSVRHRETNVRQR